MIKINKYITEKLHLNKNSKVIDDYDRVIKTIKEMLDYIFSPKCSNSFYRNDDLDDKFFEFNIDKDWIYMKCTNKFFKKYKPSDTYNIFCLLAEYKNDFGFENLSISRRESDYTFIFRNWKFKDE